MRRDKKWSSNDKNQLLVENFRKFMEEGDFSAEEELSERSWLQMGKDVMKGDFSGDKRKARELALAVLEGAQSYLGQWGYKTIDKALQKAADYSGMDQRIIKTVGASSVEDLVQKYAPEEYVRLKDMFDNENKPPSEEDELAALQHQNYLDAMARVKNSWKSKPNRSGRTKEKVRHTRPRGDGFGDRTAPWDE
jgi:hypothetical protein